MQASSVVFQDLYNAFGHQSIVVAGVTPDEAFEDIRRTLFIRSNHASPPSHFSDLTESDVIDTDLSDFASGNDTLSSNLSGDSTYSRYTDLSTGSVTEEPVSSTADYRYFEQWSTTTLQSFGLERSSSGSIFNMQAVESTAQHFVPSGPAIVSSVSEASFGVALNHACDADNISQIDTDDASEHGMDGNVHPSAGGSGHGDGDFVQDDQTTVLHSRFGWRH